MPPLTRARSLLFMPASRADKIAKIPRIAPDVAVADLEDAVAAGDKERARDIAVAAIDALERPPSADHGADPREPGRHALVRR